jgi:hypothetical protein
VHTVIITDQRTTRLFGEFRHLFAPFLTDNGGSVCQCAWHEAGTDIENAVPELYKSIKGYPEWRAIILVHPAQTELFPFNSHNPFDFICNREGEKNLLNQEKFAPLVCLTHMLAGFPSPGVKGYEMVYACYNPKTCDHDDCTYNNGKCVKVSEFETFSESEKAKVQKKCGNGLMPRLMEIEYEKDEKERYQQFKKKYAFKENRPEEVLILTTREMFEPDDRDTTREAIRRAWEFHYEEESSDFWKIYPNTCRFLCYDLINTEHTWYPRELWRFFLLTLTLAVNQIPGQALQAYRLYKADLKINADDLRRVLDKHNETLLSVQSFIQERLLRSPELTQEKEKELVPGQDISVKFEHVDEGDVKAKDEEFGLASDCPILETRFWREYIQETKQTIDNIFSAPQEIVASKALETRHKAYDFSGREQVLDRFQIDRVHKRIDELEAQVINANVYGILDTDAHKAEVAEAGDAVRKNLGLRLTKRNILLISLCSLFTYLCGYIPFLINSAKISRSVFGASLGLALVALVLLAVGGLLTLWVSRHRIIKIIKTYNQTIRAIFDNINKGSQIYSDYFSSVCTYMYARSLLSGVILKQDSHYTERKMQKVHLSALESKIKKNRELCSLYDVPSNDSSVVSAYTEITENFLMELPSTNPLYELSQYKTKKSLELENTGETLDAPYSFVESMIIVREEIYDKEGA